MKYSKIFTVIFIIAIFLMFVPVKQTKALITSGPDIILPPPSVNNETAYGGNPGGGVSNTHQQGFNERQGVLLTSALAVDSGSIPAGTRVDSHMIFYNFVDKPNDGNPYQDGPHDWQFSGTILGVMSDNYGNSEIASSPILGSPSTVYPSITYLYRGLGDTPGDHYSINGSTLTVECGGYTPGDWARVITQSSDPIPTLSEWGMIIFIALLVGSALWVLKRRSKQETV